MNDSAQQELMKQAVEIAKRIVSGATDPHEGCTEIDKICTSLEFPDDLLVFGLLAHDQSGHDHLGITAETCLPDILTESKKLIERSQQENA